MEAKPKLLLIDHWHEFKNRFGKEFEDPIRRAAELIIIRFMAQLHGPDSLDEDKLQGSYIKGFDTDYVNMVLTVTASVPTSYEPPAYSRNFTSHPQRIEYTTEIPLSWMEQEDPIYHARLQILERRLAEAENAVKTQEGQLVSMRATAEQLRTSLAKHKESKNGQDTQTTQVVQGHDPAASQTG